MRRASRPRTCLVASLIMMAGVVSVGNAALACGYHNPSDVARGIMNLVFPKSLYVRTAVWQAQASGVLPPRAAKPAKDLFAYQRAASDLRDLGARLAAPNRGMGTFTVVLLDSMLWTRFVPGPDGYTVALHVDGPQRGDAVLVTETVVVHALLDGSLDVKTAEAHGLFRLYGPIGLQAATRTALGTLSSNSSPPSAGKSS